MPDDDTMLGQNLVDFRNEGRRNRTEQVFASMRSASEMVAALPPRPRCFMAHHSVPYGQVFRQWNTRGELIVWVNRGEIEDLPRKAAKRTDGWAIAPNAIDMELLLSIPVVIA